MKLFHTTITRIAIGITAAITMIGTPAMAADLRVRKNVEDLTPQEKQEFVNAIKTLKNTYTPGSKVSVYDQFVVTHVQTMGLMSMFGPTGPAAGADAAHQGDAFLPWHRELLDDFEQALESVDPNVTIPYWDWTDPNAIKNIFSDDFLGPNGQGEDITIPNVGVFRGGPVQSGYFSEANGWVLDSDINVNPFTGQSYGTSLKRYLLGPTADQLISKEDQANVLALNNYDQFRLALEGFTQVDDKGNQVLAPFPFTMHNYMHGVVGGGYFDSTLGIPIVFGTMANIASSPYDPVFWLLHSNVDRLWAEWQDNGHAGSAFYPSKGLAQTDNGLTEQYGHGLNDPMWPWDGGQSTPGKVGPADLLSDLPHFTQIVTPADVLDFRKLGYRYDTTPASVPEPTSTLCLLVLGALGAGSLLTRKRKQKTLLYFSGNCLHPEAGFGENEVTFKPNDIKWNSES
jgi:tyrosinase